MRTLRKRKVEKKLCFEGRNFDDDEISSFLEVEGKQKVRSLFLGGNKIRTIELIVNFTALETLDLKNNKISSLPPSLAKLQSLERLYLQNNKLKTVPDEYASMAALNQICLDGNPLTHIHLAKSFFTQQHVRNAITEMNTERANCVYMAMDEDAMLTFRKSNAELEFERVICPILRKEPEYAFYSDMCYPDPWLQCRNIVYVVKLPLDRWGFEDLKDTIFDKLKVKLSDCEIRCTPTNPLILKELPSLDEDEDGLPLRWNKYGDLWLYLKYKGAKYVVCSCHAGAFSCKVHGYEEMLYSAFHDDETLEDTLRRGLTPFYRTKEDATLLDLLIQHGSKDAEIFLKQVKLLLQYGWVVDASSTNYTALTCRSEEVAQFLNCLHIVNSCNVDDVFEADLKFQDFKIIERLGEKVADDGETVEFSGVCSAVYFALYKGFQCVVKIQYSDMGKNDVGNSLLKEQFTTEWQVMKDVRHANIMPLLANFEDTVDGSKIPNFPHEKEFVATCLIMPYFPKNLLQALRARQHRNLPYWTNYEIKRYAKQLFEAVRYMQNHGIAHRDLKPDNILIQSLYLDPCLLICDFGMAHYDKEGSLKLPYGAKGATVGGASKYLPPEIRQINVSVLDYSKSDNWACGMVLYRMLGHKGSEPYLQSSDAYEDLPYSYCPEIRGLVKGLLSHDQILRSSMDEALVQLDKIPLESCHIKDGKRYN